MTEVPRRPVERADLERVYALIHAVGTKQESDEPLDAILSRIHDDWNIEALAGADGQPFVGEEMTSVELNRAAIVLECLMLHDGEMPDRPARAPSRPCITCRRVTTFYGECLDCRYKRLLDSGTDDPG